MNLTDEVLSAFLDGELPEADMQTIRSRLVTDPALGERLADHVTHREPPATRAGVRALRTPPCREGCGTLADLGIQPRPLQRTLVDTLESLGEAIVGPSVV